MLGTGLRPDRMTPHAGSTGILTCKRPGDRAVKGGNHVVGNRYWRRHLVCGPAVHARVDDTEKRTRMDVLLRDLHPHLLAHRRLNATAGSPDRVDIWSHVGMLYVL